MMQALAEAQAMLFRRMKDENLTRLLTRSLSLWSSSSSCSSCNHARACESQKRVVIRMSRREQDGIEAEAWSIDRDDEKHKRDEMRHSDEWSRWVCMGLV